MKFEIRFLTPFRVAAGHAGYGADATVDRGVPLPASSIKGIMRSTARDLLRLPAELVDPVFGTGRGPSPWSWSDALPVGDGPLAADIQLRARIQIDPETGTARDGALSIAEEVHATRLNFTVTRTGWIEEQDRDRHQLVLMVSARAVTALGGDRRRGLGWVAVTPIDPPWTDTGVEAVVAGLTRSGAST